MKHGFARLGMAGVCVKERERERVCVYVCVCAYS